MGMIRRLRTCGSFVVRLLRRLLAHPRYQVMAVMVAAALILGDRLFPFSSFPMYAGFPDRTHYVYLADGEGHPLPMHDFFGYRTTKIKRIYSNEMRDIFHSLKESSESEEGDEIKLHTMTDEQLRPRGMPPCGGWWPMTGGANNARASRCRRCGCTMWMSTVVRTGDCVARRAGWVRMREVSREWVVATRVARDLGA
jgi:hypothetical protein